MLSPPNRLRPLAISIIIACCPSAATAGFRVLEEVSSGSNSGPRAATAERYYSPIPNVVLSFQGKSSQLTPRALRELLDFVRNAAPNARYAIVSKGNKAVPESTIAARVAKTQQALSEFGVDTTRFALTSGPDYEDEVPTPFVRVFIVPAHLVAVAPQAPRPTGAAGLPSNAQVPGANQQLNASALSNADVQVEIANRLLAISQQGKLEPQTALMLLQSFLAKPGQEGASALAAAQANQHPAAAAVGRRPAEVEPHWRNADAAQTTVTSVRQQRPAVAVPTDAYEGRGSVRHAVYRDNSAPTVPLSAAAFAPLPSPTIATAMAAGGQASYRADGAPGLVRPQRPAEFPSQELSTGNQPKARSAFVPQTSLVNLAAAPARPAALIRAPEAGNVGLQAGADESDAVDAFFGIQRKPPVVAPGAVAATTGNASPAASEASPTAAPIALAALAALPEPEQQPASVPPVEIPTISLPGDALDQRGSGSEPNSETVTATQEPAPASSGFKVSPYLVTSTALPAFPVSGNPLPALAVASADIKVAPSAQVGVVDEPIRVAAAPLPRSNAMASLPAASDDEASKLVTEAQDVSAGATDTIARPMPTWQLDAGMTLRDNLAVWASGAGYRLKWEASNYIQVVTPRTYNAEFLDVVKDVGQAVSSLVHIQVYPDAAPPEIRVSDALQ